MEKEKVLKIIGQNLRTLINEQSMTVNELARRSNVSAGTISKIMNGNMGLTVTMAMTIANGLKVDIASILQGLSENPELLFHKKTKKQRDDITIGLLSLNNRRITCICDYNQNIIGFSELENGLDLAESFNSLQQLINESIASAVSDAHVEINLKKADINLVLQSYEFEDTRVKFINFMQRFFNQVTILSDWQLTHMCNFDKTNGISLIVDKGISLSYKYQNSIRKIGGWKFPLYDIGGENWLGVESIKHTIEAYEGFIPMSNLARTILSKHGSSLNVIVELCFKGNTNHDVYCIFSEILINQYLNGVPEAKFIIEKGKKHVKRLLQRADDITKIPGKIALQGSLRKIYESVVSKERLIEHKDNFYKAEFLAKINQKTLQDFYIIER